MISLVLLRRLLRGHRIRLAAGLAVVTVWSLLFPVIYEAFSGQTINVPGKPTSLTDFSTLGGTISIGGRAVLHLALRHGGYFRAAIGLQSATHADPGADTRLRDLGVLHRPDVHGQEAAAGSVACLIAPTSPSSEAWETLWHYMQGGPGIFLGDLHYYFAEGDLRNGLLDTLDTKKCPLHLLTGEYDFSCTAEDTLRTAGQIPGANVQIMKELGHFPMSENPSKFREYILPVLDRIAKKG